jgi:Protein of unknown function (DUF1569)
MGGNPHGKVHPSEGQSLGTKRRLEHAALTPGRRTLGYETFDEVMLDVERLLQGHTTVGNGTLAQICRHLAAIRRRHVDLPASTTFDPSDRVSEDRKRRIMETGVLPEGIEAPPGVLPAATLSKREEAEGLCAAIGDYRASAGPGMRLRIPGSLTRDERHRIELIHCAHHVSFAVPTAAD